MKRRVINQIISKRYKDGSDQKRRIVNLFFSNIIRDNEYNEILELLTKTSERIRGGLEIPATKEGREKMWKGKDRKYIMAQIDAMDKFREKGAKDFEFQIGNSESNLYFKIGPSRSYFFIEMDHYLKNDGSDINKYVTYNVNKRFEYKTKHWTYKPTVYINTKRALFRNILNFMKECDLLDEFVYGFEEKVLMNI